MQKTKFLYCFLFLVFSLLVIFSSLFLKQIIFSNLSNVSLYSSKTQVLKFHQNYLPQTQNYSLKTPKNSTFSQIALNQLHNPTSSNQILSHSNTLSQTSSNLPHIYKSTNSLNQISALTKNYNYQNIQESKTSHQITLASEITTLKTTPTDRYREILVDTPLFKTTTDDDQSISDIYFLLPKSYFVEIVKECTLDSGSLGYKVNYGDFSGFARASDLSTETFSTSTTQIGTEITLYSDAGTYIRSTPTISNNRIRIIPQATSGIIYIGSIYGDKPSDGTSNLWFLVEYNFGDTSTVLGYIYSERAILASPLIELEKPQVSDQTETTPTTQTPTTADTPQKTTLSLSISPALKWIIALLFIIPAIVIFLLLVKKPKRQVFDNEDAFGGDNTNSLDTPTGQHSSIFTTSSTLEDGKNLPENNNPSQSDNLDILPEFANFSDITEPSNAKKSKLFRKNNLKNQNLRNNSQKSLKFSRDFEPFVNFQTTLEVSKEIDPSATQNSNTDFSTTSKPKPQISENNFNNKNLTLLSENSNNDFSKNTYQSTANSSNQTTFSSEKQTNVSSSNFWKNQTAPTNPTRLENSYDEYFGDTQKLKKSIENSNPISRPTFPKINIDDSEFGEDFSISTPFSSVLGTEKSSNTRRRFNKK